MPLEFLTPVKEVLGQYLLNLHGLNALWFLVPVILVYLIKPRPKKKTIPALMFLMKERSRWNKSSFLRRLVRDPLFLFQIFIILAFAVALSAPYIIVDENVFVKKAVIVIDVSASMQTSLAGQTRLQKAIDIAKENLASKNAIVTIGAIPELVVDDASKEKASAILDKLKPKDTPTDIFDAIIFAGNYARPKDHVVVISDFIETSSHKDFNAAKNILKSKGMYIDFFPIINSSTPKASNIGIIDLDVNEDRTSVQIRNFNDEPETVGLKLEGANLSKKSLDLEAGGGEVINFPTPGMLSKFSIIPKQGHDDLLLDNDVYISAPSKEDIPLLLISNDRDKFLETALSVIPLVKVTKGSPPKVPEVEHKIIIIDQIRPDLILPGTMKNIRKKVEDGAALIVVAQPSLLQVDFLGLLPVERKSNSEPVVMSKSAYVLTSQITSLTEDINFGHVDKYLNMKPKKDAMSLAVVGNNVTMVAMRNYGKGLVVYVGMMPDYSDFKTDIYYPIFWKRIFDMALKKQDVSELNYKTGAVAHLLKRQTVVTPDGKVNEEKVILDHQGIYRSEERNFVANLLNERESAINGGEDEMKGVFDESLLTEEKTPFDLSRRFLIGLFVLVLLELLWIKFRGDI